MKKIFLTCFFLWFVVQVNANSTIFDQYRFKQFSTLNYLPSDEVQKVYYDKEGLIWFATRSGLCSYDGYQVQNYRSNVLSYDLLSSNNVLCLAEDYSFHLWIGTQNGLCMLDKRTGVIKKYTISGINSKVVSCLLVTRDNTLWVGTDQGLCRYLPTTHSFMVYSAANTNNQMDGCAVKSLLQDLNGDILIGTWSSGLYRFSPKKNTFKLYPRLNVQNSAHTLFFDSRKRLWIGTWNYGLICMDNPRDMKHSKIHLYTKSMVTPNSLSDNIVYSISEDPITHSLWVGTRSGLSIMDMNDPARQFVNFSVDNPVHNIPANEINSIITNKKGDIWIGSIGGGVFQINTRPSLFRSYGLNALSKYVSTHAVRSLFVDPSGLIWMGIGSYGLSVYDRKTNISRFYREMPEFSQIKDMPTVYSAIDYGNGELWFGTYGDGILIYKKGQNVEFISMNNKKYMLDNCVQALYKDKKGAVWIGQRFGLSIVLFNRKGYVVNFMHEGNREFSSSIVQNITEDHVGRMWISTEDNGIIRVEGDVYHPTTLRFHNYSPTNKNLQVHDVISVLPDHKGNIWAISNSGGLFLYNVQKDAFESVNERFHIPGDEVCSIQEDQFGNLWLGTNFGIVKVSFTRGLQEPIVRTYSSADGLDNNFFIPDASCKYGDELFFGHYKGFYSFVPTATNSVNRKPPIIITDLKVNNRSYATLDFTLRKKISLFTPSFTQKIVLPPSVTNFTFEFAALTYINPEQNKYAYQLVGFDKDWQYTDARHRFAYYNNLSSGTYTFRLKATDGTGKWYEMSFPIKVVVLPPFYATWWAYLIYLCIVIGIVYTGLHISRTRMELRNSLRIKEMERKHIEMLNHSKLQFFTNITHELLTPLTIISATVDNLKMLAPQNMEYYGIMKTNVNRLIRLLQQILEFRKAQTGNLKLRVSRGNLSAFVKNEVESFYPLMNKKKLHLSFVCDPQDLLAYFDLDKMDKVIYNLLSNAAKYNHPNGFVQVNLTYGEDKDHVILTVKDNGIGLSEEAKLHLFERFYDGEYRKSQTIGTGIGLSLTKDLVQLHGGVITVESREGFGTTFFVTIPIDRSYYKEDDIDDEMPEPMMAITDLSEEDEKEPDTTLTEKNHSVLVIEDNEELLSLMNKLLSRDYQVFTATNGKEGITVIENENVDLVVSDVMMPEMDGIEFTKYVKGVIDYCHIPIILLTAKTKDEDRTEAYDSGADAFITKPFQLSVLHARIKNLIKSRERVKKDFKNQVVFELKDFDYTSMDQAFLQKAIDCVNNHLDNSDFDQPQFAEGMDMSKSTLYKKLKSLTGLNTSAFIRNIRLKAACKIAEEKAGIRISDLAYSVGFNDPKYFSSCFKREFGMLPSEYIDKFISTGDLAKEDGNEGETIV
jgi:signal transduction histidine kinase/ligand-binding sensor domain-containing protein/DNA-binding response OmpR family regulator